MQARGTSISLRVRHRHLPCHRQAREARLWVEVEDKAHRSGLQGQRCIYAVVPPIEPTNLSVIQVTCLLYRLWERILFDSIASHLFIAASCVRGLGLEVETLEKPLYVSSPLGTRVSVDLLCRGCELEIFGILLTMNLRVMDMSEFDVILGMDWLTAHQVVTVCERRRVTAYA